MAIVAGLRPVKRLVDKASQLRAALNLQVQELHGARRHRRHRFSHPVNRRLIPPERQPKRSGTLRPAACP